MSTFLRRSTVVLALYAANVTFRIWSKQGRFSVQVAEKLEYKYSAFMQINAFSLAGVQKRVGGLTYNNKCHCV